MPARVPILYMPPALALYLIDRGNSPARISNASLRSTWLAWWGRPAGAVGEHDVGDVSGTVSLVRMSSRHPPQSSTWSSVPRSRNSSPPATLSPLPFLVGCRLPQVGDQLRLSAAAGHRIEHQTRDNREGRQQHQA